MNKVILITLIFGGLLTSCGGIDPLDYQAVQEEKQKISSGHVETPKNHSIATVAGLPEKLSTLESFGAHFASVRIPVILKNGDTAYAATSYAIEATFLTMGEKVFVHNESFILKSKNEVLYAEGEIVTIHKSSLVNEISVAEVLLGNKFTPIKISMMNKDADFEQWEIVLGKKVMVRIENPRPVAIDIL